MNNLSAHNLLAPYKFIGEINEMKAKVTSGEYALAMVRFTDYNNGYFHYALMKKYYMTKDDFAYNYPINNDRYVMSFIFF